MNQLEVESIERIECEGFWRWYMRLRITGFVDFVQRPEFYTHKTRKHNVSETGSISVFRRGGGGGDNLLGPLERANINHWTTHIIQ
jgi:hypothetical protein